MPGLPNDVSSSNIHQQSKSGMKFDQVTVHIILVSGFSVTLLYSENFLAGGVDSNQTFEPV